MASLANAKQGQRFADGGNSVADKKWSICSQRTGLAFLRICSLGRASVIQWKNPVDSEVARTVDVPANRSVFASFFSAKADA